MAERRMFAKTIIDSDAFLDMPVTSQLLYFHLAMRADDDGFVNSPKSIMRMVGAKDDDAKALIQKKFILPFDSGVIVIKHWRLHNCIKSDRYIPTKYKEEMAALELDENKSYRVVDENHCIQSGTTMEPQWNQSGTKVEPQVRLGKVSIGKESISSCAESQETSAPVVEFDCIKGERFGVHQEKVDEWTQTYPALDVVSELRKMKSWLEANPTKIKTKAGMPRFVVNWLSKAQDKGGSGSRYVSDWSEKQRQSGRLVDRPEPSNNDFVAAKRNSTFKLKRGGD